MITLAYQPPLLSLHTDIGLKRGLAFVVDPARPVDAPPVLLEATVEFVATASGFNELGREYLYDTGKSLQACCIRDHELEKLAAAVQQRLASC